MTEEKKAEATEPRFDIRHWYSEKEREEIIKGFIGMTVTDMYFEEGDRYWVMTFSDGAKLSFHIKEERQKGKITVYELCNIIVNSKAWDDIEEQIRLAKQESS